MHLNSTPLVFLRKSLDQWGLNLVALSVLGFTFLYIRTTFVPTVIVVLCSLCFVVDQQFRRRCVAVFSNAESKWIAWLFLGWFISDLLLRLIHLDTVVFSFPENEFRFLIAITLLALPVKPATKKIFWISLLVASVGSALDVAYEWVFFFDDFQRVSGTTNNQIHFGNLSALVMLLCITFSFLAEHTSVKHRLVYLGAALLALFAALASGSRSSAIVFVCLVPLLLLANKDHWQRRLSKLAAAFFIVSLTAIALVPQVQEKLRLQEFSSDVERMAHNDYVSSVGARVAMWRTAWMLFEEHPVAGVGLGKFEGEIVKRVKEGKIPATEIYGQPHSDLMHAASSGGLIKLSAYIAMMLGSFLYFYKKYMRLRDNHLERIIPVMGMQVVAAYFLFGLTNSNFDLQIYSMTFATLMCLFAAICENAVTATAPSTP